MTNLAIWRGDFDGQNVYLRQDGVSELVPRCFRGKEESRHHVRQRGKDTHAHSIPDNYTNKNADYAIPNGGATKAPTTQPTPAPTPANDASAINTSTTRQPSASWPTERAIEASIGAIS